MKFAYKATDKDGEIIEGTAEAPDKFQLARDLRVKDQTIISARPASEKGHDWFQKINGIFYRVSFKEKIFFSNNLSEMVSAGLPLSRALSVLNRQTKNQKLQKVIKSLLEVINKGGNFASGLEKYPKIFSPVFVAMVSAGEKSGRLPESLKIIATQMEKTYNLRKKVKGALIYPGIIISAMVLIGILMLIFVVPTLAETFEDFGAELPMTTKGVILVSEFLVNYYLFAIVAIVALLFGFVKFLKTKSGKRIFSAILMRLPLFGKISKQMNSAVTARTLSSLISSGVDIVESLNITTKVLQNPYYKEILIKAAEEVPKGKTLSSIFIEAEEYYPPFVGEMTLVGEETGKMSEMLLKMSTFYEKEVDGITKNLSTIIEPVIMVLVGIAVAFFAVSMIQPIYSIGESI